MNSGIKPDEKELRKLLQGHHLQEEVVSFYKQKLNDAITAVADAKIVSAYENQPRVSRSIGEVLEKVSNYECRPDRFNGLSHQQGAATIKQLILDEVIGKDGLDKQENELKHQMRVRLNGVMR